MLFYVFFIVEATSEEKVYIFCYNCIIHDEINENLLIKHKKMTKINNTILPKNGYRFINKKSSYDRYGV